MYVHKLPTAHTRELETMIRISHLEITRDIDYDPDLSHLEDPQVQGEEYFEENQKRLADYGETWYMMGVKVTATLDVTEGHASCTEPLSRRTEQISSCGIWGVESDSDADYIKELAAEEFNNLRTYLKEFALHPNDTRWNGLVADAIADIT